MAKGEVPQGPPVSQPPIGFFSLEHPEFEVGYVGMLNDLSLLV